MEKPDVEKYEKKRIQKNKRMINRKTTFLIPRKSESSNWRPMAFTGSTDESIQAKKYPF